MMTVALKSCLAAILLVANLAVPGAPYAEDDGVAAYANGDYVTALRLFRPMAATGDAYAETYLGVMSTNGQGVPQDYVGGRMVSEGSGSRICPGSI